ncbi:response regulator [Flavobacteriaceae bacterium KMM 6898]|nr:response regulator [Flavobacteriaceae bacterium KMM 6898]
MPKALKIIKMINIKRIGYNYITVCFFILCVFFAKKSYTQSFDYKIGVLNNESNIANNVVSSFYKDDKGFLWIGKMDGLYKYNGYDFKVFTNIFEGNIGLSNPWVTDVDEIKNYLTVGTKNGLNLLDKSKESFKHIFPSDYNSNLSNHITCLNILEKSNIIQVGLSNGFLQVHLLKDGNFKVDQIEFEDFRNTKENLQVHKIFKIEEGSLIHTSNNIFLLEPNSSVAKKIIINRIDGSLIKDFDAIYVLNDKKIIGSFKGETFYINSNINFSGNSYKATARPISEIFPNWPPILKINNFFVDINGKVWIGTEGEGLYVYHRQTENWQNYRYKPNLKNVIKNDFIRAIYEDKSGMLIVGSDAGVNVIYNQQNKFHIRNSISNTTNGTSEMVNVHGILEDRNNNLWIGTRGKGIFIVNNEYEENISAEVNNSLNHIRAIIEDKLGEIWIGTQNGIYIISNDKNKKSKNLTSYFKNREPNYLAGEHIYAILEDNAFNKWISTANGLFVLTTTGKLKKITNSSIGTSLDNKIIYSLKLDSNDRIWFGTLNGMIAYLDYKDYKYSKSIFSNTGKPLDFKLIKIDEEFKKYFQNYETYSFCEVGTKEIYVGTNFGLCKIDLYQKKLIPLFSLNKSLNSVNVGASYVYGLLFDDSNNTLWGSSNNGLFAYNFNKMELQRFGMKDGLQSLEFNGNSVYKGKNGNLYFGGANGLNWYNNSVTLTKSDYKPNLVLTKLFVNGKQVGVQDDTEILNKAIAYTKEINLNSEYNTLGLEFASLDLAHSTNNFYKCKLIGVDKNWRYLSNKRSINYASLPKGTYEFKLIGSNNDGVWNTEELSLKIIVLPAWYATWWMILLWYLIGVIIIMVFVIIVLKNRDNRNELRIKEIEQIKITEIYESKLVLFTNISHELRTPLSLILDPIQSLIQQKSTYNNNKDLLDIIRNNVERLRRLIDQIMDFRKHEYGKLELTISEGNIIESIKGISHSFDHLSKIKNINFKLNFPNHAIQMFYDQDKIEKILYNILSNAFKVVNTGGKIKVSIEELNINKYLMQSSKYTIICGDKTFGDYSNYVCIKISDNGIGISNEHIHDVFTRFYQDDTVNSGTGIGLYMVKQLTEMHNGTVLLKSKKDKGSTFIIILPKNKDLYQTSSSTINKSYVNKEEEIYFPAVNNEKLVSQGSKDYTVVIVEDNDELRMYLKLILQNYFNVYTANNGLEGIDLIQEVAPDIIISDIIMPEINGLELCKRIKENFETSHIPIILLTAKAFDKQIVEGINSGADDYITKPFNKEILVAKINNLIKNREKLRLMFQNSKILEPSKVTVTSIDEKLLWKLKQSIEENIQNPNLTLEMLATEVGTSRAQLFRKVKALTGLTPNNFIKSLRLKFAVQLLEQEKFQKAEIAYLSGFKEASYFSRCFKETYGCSPKEYKNNYS